MCEPGREREAEASCPQEGCLDKQRNWHLWVIPSICDFYVFIYVEDVFTCLKEYETYREILHLWIYSPNGWNSQGLGQAKAQTLELHPGLPCGWQES